MSFYHSRCRTQAYLRACPNGQGLPGPFECAAYDSIAARECALFGMTARSGGIFHFYGALQDMSPPTVIVVIPARYGSTRLPGKPLLSLAGKPMIQRVYERAKMARRVGRVIVATDDERIVKAVETFGGEARMTRPDHRTGTERVAEVAAHVEGDVFVNVQGDEPLLDPAAVDTAVDALLEDPPAAIATVATPIKIPADIMDPNVVKVILDFDDNALYFSRAPIPWVRDTANKSRARHLKHLGLYVFQRDANTPRCLRASSNASSSSNNCAGSKTAGRFASRRSLTTPSAWTSPKTSPASRSFCKNETARPTSAGRTYLEVTVVSFAEKVYPQSPAYCPNR